MLLQGRDTPIDSIFRAVTEVKIQVKRQAKNLAGQSTNSVGQYSTC